jgi:hypothetical protein
MHSFYIVNGAKRNKNGYRGISRDILSPVQARVEE